MYPIHRSDHKTFKKDNFYTLKIVLCLKDLILQVDNVCDRKNICVRWSSLVPWPWNNVTDGVK